MLCSGARQTARGLGCGVPPAQAPHLPCLGAQLATENTPTVGVQRANGQPIGQFILVAAPARMSEGPYPYLPALTNRMRVWGVTRGLSS